MDHATFARLARIDQARLKNSAKAAQRLEDDWTRRITDLIASFTPEVIQNLNDYDRMPDLDFETIFIEHYFEVSIKSIRYAMTDIEEHTYLPPRAGVSMARVRPRTPPSLADLMRAYDAWRKGGKKPRRAVKQAKAIKKAYLEKVASVWEKHSQDFRSGGTGGQEEVVRKIKAAAQTTEARARTIVRTETTTYYNQARKSYYDGSRDITHYLFIAIRDATTSPWCTPQTIDGKRGRSGLVYAKSDPLCEKETPACHPGCRSEFLPLNRLNPAHLKFIQDEKLARRNHECFPLLRGWHAA